MEWVPFPCKIFVSNGIFHFYFKSDFRCVKISLDPLSRECLDGGSPGLIAGLPPHDPVGLPPCVRPGLSELGLVFLTGYIRTGSIFLAQTQDRLISLKRINSRLKYV